MKTRKIGLIAVITFGMMLLSQMTFAQGETTSFAYISVTGKLFSKKLNVEVDFGDTPEQMAEGEEYSNLLSTKRSYAAVLNYMVENEFELVETLDFVNTFQGTGGTSGLVFIMRRRE